MSHSVQLERHLGNEWTAVSGYLTVVCNRWARRRDLTVYCGVDGGKGKASAFFLPTEKQIEINSTDAFGGVEAKDVGDLRDRMVLSNFPVAGGLALHESGHARYTEADWEQVRPRFDSESAWEVFQCLEETRIEGRMVLAWPKDRGYLRASCQALLMAEPKKWSGRFVAQLLLGRKTVGVLDATDVAKARKWILKQDRWTADILDEVDRIVGEHFVLEDTGADLDRQIALAIELDAIMPQEPGGSEGEDEREGAGEMLGEVLGRLSRVASSEVLAQALSEQAAEARAKEKRAQEDAAKNREKAEQVFGPRNLTASFTPTKMGSTRKPTAEEKRAAVELARDLEKARYRDRIVQEYADIAPPGRFHGGEAMRRQAAIDMRAPSSGFKPFTKRKRIEVEESTLSVGIMCDVSGSMQSVQAAVGSATWIISDAVYRLSGARAAQLYFGDKAYPGLRVNERLRDVRTWDAGGSYEHFDAGFRALDGALDLLNGSGARLLFVISDGEYKAGAPIDQNAARDRWIKACVENGVGVVWISLTAPEVTPVPGLEVVTVTGSMTDTIDVIGRACIKSLAKVSGVG